MALNESGQARDANASSRTDPDKAECLTGIYGSEAAAAAIPRMMLRTELILAVGVVLEVVLVISFGLPEAAGLADLGHDLVGPDA
jgi:hypothetical protein